MLIFDQLKKDDPQLRAVALAVAAGLCILLAGLWWVQVVSAREFQANLETQSFRTVRIPAVRGKILDCTRTNVLAENRPTYNISLYLDELRKPFDKAYSEEAARARAMLKQQLAEEEKKLNRKLTRKERKMFLLSSKEKDLLRQQARYEVASNVVAQLSQRLQEPLTLNPTNFELHYERRLALPFPVVTNVAGPNIARFEEQMTSPLGADLDVQSTRVYPCGTAAAHVLGSLRRDDSSAEGEEASFSYRLPDYRGAVGVEFGCDKALRGLAGAKSVLVNNVGYRQTENIWSPAEPGHNVVLTIDLGLQEAAERALQSLGAETRGAVVVLDVQNGDILAMASAPTFNPNYSVQGFPAGELQRRHDPKLRPEINRATQENYAPGSVFKTVVGMAALEAGLDPARIYHFEPDPASPSKACIFVGRLKKRDTAPPGDYDFRRALKLSCNSYFITNGLRTGPQNIVRLGQRLHFGERTGLPTRQEVAGAFPDLDRVRFGWSDGNTANMCIGQDPVLVTPLQVAVLTAAIANGGKVLWPRLVDRVEPQDPTSPEPAIVFEHRPPRDELGVSAHTMRLLHDAMLADTEDADGTGRRAAVPGLRICAKTGTAQIQNERNQKTGQTTWIASFAPYEKPRYAVVVMVEDGESGGTTCAPVAGKIYALIAERERKAGATATLAKGN